MVPWNDVTFMNHDKCTWEGSLTCFHTAVLRSEFHGTVVFSSNIVELSWQLHCPYLLISAQLLYRLHICARKRHVPDKKPELTISSDGHNFESTWFDAEQLRFVSAPSLQINFRSTVFLTDMVACQFLSCNNHFCIDSFSIWQRRTYFQVL